MMFTHKNLMTVCCAAVLAFGLAACGSSSSDDKMAAMATDSGITDSDAKTPAEILAEASDALAALPEDATDDAKEMAQELVDVALRLPGNEAELIASLDAKVAQAEERQSALDLTEQDRQDNADELQNAEAALASASAEDKEAAQAAVDDALQLPGNEAELIASLEQQVDDAAQAKKVADAAAAAEEASDMAKAVILAIQINTDDLDANPAAQMVTLAASSVGELTANREGYTMSAAPEEIADWRGRTLEKDGDTTVIYTNIEDEVPTSLDGLYARASSLPGAAQTYMVTTSGDVATIEWADAKRADSKEDVDRSGVDAVMTFAGSVRGVDGTFSCTGETTCTAPIPMNGVINSDETWSFAPDDPGAMIQVKDKAYVSFGWWLNAMGTDGYEFDAFASATGMDARSVEAAVEGSATYKGAAAGKWAMQSTSDDSASGGHFTAAATLTANFDANTDTSGDATMANESGVSIGGSITDFMTGDVSRPNWRVKLTGPDPVPTTIVATGVSGTTSWTTGGAVPGAGTWNAIFYGTEEVTNHPMAATGEFNADIGGVDNIARISGAFGATKQ